MRTTSSTGLAGTQMQDAARGPSARVKARPAISDACPEDCHYCWGPETD